MRIIIKKEIGKEAAKLLGEELKNNSKAKVGFATGSTQIEFYKELCKKKIRLHETFNLDEYYPMMHHDSHSYRYFMHKHLFSKIKVGQVHFLDGEAKDADGECKRYGALIKKKGIDVQILGIGANGHIGFNEPGSSINSKTRIVELSSGTRVDNSRFFKDADSVPNKALTMGISTIMNAKKIILIATGKHKAKAIKDMAEGPVNAGCPASFLRRHPNVVVIVDSEAASLLEKTHDISEVRGFGILTKDTIPKNKKIVVISPHPDDAAIGPGATIAKLSAYNEVHTFVMTTGHRAFIKDASKDERIIVRENEVRCESRFLGTTPHFLRLELYDKRKIGKNDVLRLKKELKSVGADIILIPRKGDNHPTHKLCRRLVAENVKNVSLWEYEGPWSMFEHNEFNTIVAFNEHYKRVKEHAIRCHKSQISRTRYDVAALALEQLRGALIEEQELFGFGMKPIDLGRNIEIFNVINK